MPAWLTEALDSKAFLTLLGAIFAWAIRALWDRHLLRRRWHRLSPLIVRQISVSAELAARTFDATPLPGLDRKLSTAHRHAVEMIEAGYRVDVWLTGLVLLSDCLDTLQAASSVSDFGRVDALERLRDSAQRLLDWAQSMTPGQIDPEQDAVYAPL